MSTKRTIGCGRRVAARSAALALAVTACWTGVALADPLEVDAGDASADEDAGVPESCDCIDNDGDGLIDEGEPDGGQHGPCTSGKTCVRYGLVCQCAKPCTAGDFPCPGGYMCMQAQISETGEPAGRMCLLDLDCEPDCATVTLTDDAGAALCAPDAIAPSTCQPLPACYCHLGWGCAAPCEDVDCGAGEVCSPFSYKGAACVSDNCYARGCPGCGEICLGAACIDNPCEPFPCEAGQVCKPDPATGSALCFASCTGMDCPPASTCRDGRCVAWCEQPCQDPFHCDPIARKCVATRCAGADDGRCDDGSCCDPVTGACGDCPCEGVVCPQGESCDGGQCTGDGGAPDAAWGRDAAGRDAPVEASSREPQASDLAVGGGCGCRLTAGADERLSVWICAIALAWQRRRRKRSQRLFDREVAGGGSAAKMAAATCGRRNCLQIQSRAGGTRIASLAGEPARVRISAGRAV